MSTWQTVTRTGPVAVLAGVLVLLVGCATIPDSSPVIAGRAAGVDPRVGVVQLGGDGPVSGASPEAIVSGFLRVASGFGNDHQIARSFLTQQRRLAWRPDAAVKIYPSQTLLEVSEIGAKPVPSATSTPTETPTPTADSGAVSADVRDRAEMTRVTVTAPVTAEIDLDGRYQLSAPGATVTETFSLVKSRGEWRINALAPGILISENDFGVTFRPFPVYFADPTGRYLVPDFHWFPGTRDTLSSPELPTALVRVLLQGPPTWLQGAVITGAPPNTSMAVAAVVVEEDVATVDLTDHVRVADARQRRLLASQLQATLAQLQIGAVKITVDGVAFDIPSDSDIETDPSQPIGEPVTNPRVDERPVVIDSKGRLARLDGRTLQVVRDVGGLAVDGVNRPAVSNNSTAYAVLNADRSALLMQLPGAKVVEPVNSAALTAPSFDPEGWVWTAPGANSGFVYAAAADASAIKVKAPWLKGFEVVSMRMSRDGTRAVLAVRARGKAHLFLAGVLRDEDARPVSLSKPPPGLFPGLQTIRDVAWVQDDLVVVLGRNAGTTDEGPWLVQIGGDVSRVGNPVAGAESITAGNGEASVIAGSPKGILGRSGRPWEKVSPGRWPAFPG